LVREEKEPGAGIERAAPLKQMPQPHQPEGETRAERVREEWAESVMRSVVTPRGEPFFADYPELTKEAVGSTFP